MSEELGIIEDEEERDFDWFIEGVFAVGVDSRATLIYWLNKPHPELLEVFKEQADLDDWKDSPGLYLITVKANHVHDPWNGDDDVFIEFEDQRLLIGCDDLLSKICKTCGRFGNHSCETIGCPD